MEVFIYNNIIVPYNPYLILKYIYYINIKIYSIINIIKYIYKYIYKGTDKITFKFIELDEYKYYIFIRYINLIEIIIRIIK